LFVQFYYRPTNQVDFAVFSPSDDARDEYPAIAVQCFLASIKALERWTPLSRSPAGISEDDKNRWLKIPTFEHGGSSLGYCFREILSTHLEHRKRKTILMFWSGRHFCYLYQGDDVFFVDVDATQQRRPRSGRFDGC